MNDVVKGFRIRGTDKGRDTGNALVKDATERKDVCSMIEGKAFDLFGRHIPDRA
jgi:hypothetical protein